METGRTIIQSKTPKSELPLCHWHYLCCDLQVLHITPIFGMSVLINCMPTFSSKKAFCHSF